MKTKTASEEVEGKKWLSGMSALSVMYIKRIVVVVISKHTRGGKRTCWSQLEPSSALLFVRYDESERLCNLTLFSLISSSKKSLSVKPHHHMVYFASHTKQIGTTSNGVHLLPSSTVNHRADMSMANIFHRHKNKTKKKTMKRRWKKENQSKKWKKIKNGKTAKAPYL